MASLDSLISSSFSSCMGWLSFIVRMNLWLLDQLTHDYASWPMCCWGSETLVSVTRNDLWSHLSIFSFTLDWSSWWRSSPFISVVSADTAYSDRLASFTLETLCLSLLREVATFFQVETFVWDVLRVSTPFLFSVAWATDHWSWHSDW